MEPARRTRWHRIPNEFGDYCDGYRDDSGRFEIQRHHVDDREYAAGVLYSGEQWTYWDLVDNGSPVHQYNYLRDAKRAATAQLREEQVKEGWATYVSLSEPHTMRRSVTSSLGGADER